MTKIGDVEKSLRKICDPELLTEASADFHAEMAKGFAGLIQDANDGTLSDMGLTILLDNGYRADLLEAAPTQEERQRIWFEYLWLQQVEEWCGRSLAVTSEELAATREMLIRATQVMCGEVSA